MVFSASCPVNTVILHFPTENDTEFNSSNESQWHTQIISFSNVRWDLHKILITEIYLCVKHIINKEIWFWHVQRETTISELLLPKATSFQGWFLGVTSSLCFSQTADISGPNFLIRRRLREYPSPPPFVGSCVSVWMEGHLEHTEAWWEPWAISGRVKDHNLPTALHIYGDVQYDEYCTSHLLSYRDGRQKEGIWFHYAQDGNSDGALQLAIYFSFPFCTPMSLERQPRDP